MLIVPIGSHPLIVTISFTITTPFLVTCSLTIKASNMFGIAIKRYEMTLDNEFRAITLVTTGRYATVLKIIAVCQIGCKHIERSLAVESFHNRNKSANSNTIDFVSPLIASELQRIRNVT